MKVDDFYSKLFEREVEAQAQSLDMTPAGNLVGWPERCGWIFSCARALLNAARRMLTTIAQQEERIARLRDRVDRLETAFDDKVGWSECDSCGKYVAEVHPGGGYGTPVPEGSFCAACGGGDEGMLVYRDEMVS